jgi:hypothetical protein
MYIPAPVFRNKAARFVSRFGVMPEGVGCTTSAAMLMQDK